MSGDLPAPLLLNSVRYSRLLRVDRRGARVFIADTRGDDALTGRLSGVPLARPRPMHAARARQQTQDECSGADMNCCSGLRSHAEDARECTRCAQVMRRAQQLARSARCSTAAEWTVVPKATRVARQSGLRGFSEPCWRPVRYPAMRPAVRNAVRWGCASAPAPASPGLQPVVCSRRHSCRSPSESSRVPCHDRCRLRYSRRTSRGRSSPWHRHNNRNPLAGLP